MSHRDRAAFDSLWSEWQELDRRVEALGEKIQSKSQRPDDPQLRRWRLLVLRRSEALAALRRIEAGEPEEGRERFAAAEVAVATLFHAVWFVEHGGEDSFSNATGAHTLQPRHLLARSLERRRQGL